MTAADFDAASLASEHFAEDGPEQAERLARAEEEAAMLLAHSDDDGDGAESLQECRADSSLAEMLTPPHLAEQLRNWQPEPEEKGEQEAEETEASERRGVN